MPRSMTRMIGWLLLAGTIGVVSCQALLTAGREAPPPSVTAEDGVPSSTAPAR